MEKPERNFFGKIPFRFVLLVFGGEEEIQLLFGEGEGHNLRLLHKFLPGDGEHTAQVSGQIHVAAGECGDMGTEYPFTHQCPQDGVDRQFALGSVDCGIGGHGGGAGLAVGGRLWEPH